MLVYNSLFNIDMSAVSLVKWVLVYNSLFLQGVCRYKLNGGMNYNQHMIYVIWRMVYGADSAFRL